MNHGRVLQVNVSDGGVPKLPVEEARVTHNGVDGDRQRGETVHGGPHRAVSILGIEAIRRVAAEGHPIGPGTTGENLTTAGFDVSTLEVGARLAIGDEVVLEISRPTNPCRTIRHSFADLRFGRLAIKAHPTDSRMYARVLHEGTIRPGDRIRVEPATSKEAERFLIAHRLDDAERASSLTLWHAAAAAGYAVEILEDGELAVAAAPDLPGPMFNIALGFAQLPNLTARAVDHFGAHRVTGWIWADSAPWTNAMLDSTAVYAGASIAALDMAEADEAGIAVRELGHDEVGQWAEVVAEAAELSPPLAVAWSAFEPHLALAAHTHRFVAEVDGRVVGTGAVHLHHGVGWLRAGTVLPEYRGRGIQRALIRARIDHARRLGCDLVAASADAASPSARNLDRLGFGVAAVRGRYRVEPTT